MQKRETSRTDMAHRRPDRNDFAFQAMTEDEFRQLFKERFGREYANHEPLSSVSKEEQEVLGWAWLVYDRWKRTRKPPQGARLDTKRPLPR